MLESDSYRNRVQQQYFSHFKRGVPGAHPGITHPRRAVNQLETPRNELGLFKLPFLQTFMVSIVGIVYKVKYAHQFSTSMRVP